MTVPVTIVDAFTDQPFAGNPAAVCLLDGPRPETWMQAVAREMNLSEAAFLRPRQEGWDLRWFTPKVEVDLCGHATLASAHVLWEEGRLPRDADARFHTRSGLLVASRGEDGIRLDFPADPEEGIQPPQDLAEAMGVHPLHVGRCHCGLLLLLESEATVRDLRPDCAWLGAVTGAGVIVTAAAEGEGYDFVSRFFAPALGIDEDPVTGAAHCCLAPFWAARQGKDTLVGRQVSARGGTVRVQLSGDRVLLGGEAVTVMRGMLVGGAAGRPDS
jgi:PhzF family phenazine biosynthesis protein